VIRAVVLFSSAIYVHWKYRKPRPEKRLIREIANHYSSVANVLQETIPLPVDKCTNAIDSYDRLDNKEKKSITLLTPSPTRSDRHESYLIRSLCHILYSVELFTIKVNPSFEFNSSYKRLITNSLRWNSSSVSPLQSETPWRQKRNSNVEINFRCIYLTVMDSSDHIIPPQGIR
jgi:hypothetical protein